MKSIDDFLLRLTDDPITVAALASLLLAVIVTVLFADRWMFYARLIVKSLSRNLLRTVLTSLATFVLVLIVTMVWTVVYFLDQVTTEKSKDFKAIVTERWQIPSQMPFAYAESLARGGARTEDDVRPQDHMTWTFIGGTLDLAKTTRENSVFFFGMDPAKMMRAERDDKGNLKLNKDGKPVFNSMMDGMDELTNKEVDLLDQACREMEKDRRKVVLGKDRLAQLNKKVGETFRLSSINYRGIDLEVEVIGVFPDGRYNASALINRQYLLDAMDNYKNRNGGKAHPMADKCLNLVWLRVPDTEGFRQVADQIMESPEFKSPAVKVETGSSGVATFLDAYRGIIWGIRWLFVPAVLAVMSLVIANAISISVRERRTEMAVLKVLGYGPNQILIFVLGEALLIGALSGFLSAFSAYFFINKVVGGIPFPIAFFPAFKIPELAMLWGPMIGCGTAFVGSIAPAWSARSVKVAEVFSKIS